MVLPKLEHDLLVEEATGKRKIIFRIPSLPEARRGMALRITEDRNACARVHQGSARHILVGEIGSSVAHGGWRRGRRGKSDKTKTIFQ